MSTYFLSSIAYILSLPAHQIQLPKTLETYCQESHWEEHSQIIENTEADCIDPQNLKLFSQTQTDIRHCQLSRESRSIWTTQYVNIKMPRFEFQILLNSRRRLTASRTSNLQSSIIVCQPPRTAFLNTKSNPKIHSAIRKRLDANESTRQILNYVNIGKDEFHLITCLHSWRWSSGNTPFSGGMGCKPLLPPKACAIASRLVTLNPNNC